MTSSTLPFVERTSLSTASRTSPSVRPAYFAGQAARPGCPSGGMSPFFARHRRRWLPDTGPARGVGLVAEVDAAPMRRWSAADLDALGIDPVNARRHFQRRFGMSFLAYSRAHRVASAFTLIETGASTLSAQSDAGFESSSAFREAFSKRFGRPPMRARSSWRRFHHRRLGQV